MSTNDIGRKEDFIKLASTGISICISSNICEGAGVRLEFDDLDDCYYLSPAEARKLANYLNDYAAGVAEGRIYYSLDRETGKSVHREDGKTMHKRLGITDKT